MTDRLRAAAQAALDALINGKNVRAGEGGTKRQSTLEDAAIEQLRSALAEQDAEPVFWYRPRSDGMYDGPVDSATIESVRVTSGAWIPLYAAPPRREWQSLTDEEIEAAWKSCDPQRLLPSFAAAIEAALKEKNT